MINVIYHTTALRSRTEGTMRLCVKIMKNIIVVLSYFLTYECKFGYDSNKLLDVIINEQLNIIKHDVSELIVD